MKNLGEGSFLEKEHLQKLSRRIPVVTHSFGWLKPSCGNYHKGIMISLHAHLIIDEKDDLYDGVVCLMIFGLTIP